MQYRANTIVPSIFLVFLGLGVVAGCGPTGTGGGNGGADGGAAVPDAGGPSCTDGQTQCVGLSYQTCMAGQFEETQRCVEPQICVTSGGCSDCVPGTTYCVGSDVYQCDAAGNQGPLVESCAGGLQCGDGMCRDLCADAEANRSYLGCEYWAVDLDNAVEVMGLAGAGGPFGECPGPPFGQGGNKLSAVRVCSDGTSSAGSCDPGDVCPDGFTCQVADICGFDAQHSAFAVVVSNPHDFSVSVTIENGAGQRQTMSVGAGQVQKLYPGELGFPDQSIDGSGVQKKAYKISSDAPIVAYQFNPLDNVDVFSNDGSLLIPRTTFDTKYYAMSWPTLNRRNNTNPLAGSTNDYNGFVSIVAWTDGTEIEIAPTGDIRLGAGFAALAAGERRRVTLNAFEVLNIEADNTSARPEQDLTGTLISAVDGVATFGVFGGHEATTIQNTGTDCCADHIEEMMFPTSTWGSAYAIARSQSRGQNEPDALRILAQTDGTQVTITPAPSSGSCPTLAAGQFCDIKVMGDHEIVANNPILIGHYLLSVISQQGMGSGDPALALAVPTEQFRSTYTFLVPAEYTNQYVSIVAGGTVSVALDGADVTGQLTAFAGGAHRAARIALQPGQHTVSCPGGCGIEVYGYSDAVSYLFAGGLDLKQIVVD